jgi:annexin A7/11
VTRVNKTESSSHLLYIQNEKRLDDYFGNDQKNLFLHLKKRHSTVGICLTMESQEISKLALLISRGKPSVVKKEKFDVANDVKNIHSAFKFITNKTKIIEILCSRTNRQRIDIAKVYKTCYDIELIEIVKKKFRGCFRNLLVALLTPINEYLCTEIFEALNGAGTDEKTLIEILVTLSNREIHEICQRYNKIYGRTLEKDLRSDTSGNFRKFLIALSSSVRDEMGIVDLYTARIDAMDLKKSGIDRWGTDCSTFNRILCLRSFDQLRLICSEYEFVTGKTLEADIKKEFSGNIKDGLIAIIRYANNRPQFIARCLYKTMHGLGTNDKSLIRLVVCRCEIDMLDVKDEFLKLYGKSLKSFIVGDTSGNYRKTLLKLIGE